MHHFNSSTPSSQSYSTKREKESRSRLSSRHPVHFLQQEKKSWEKKKKLSTSGKRETKEKEWQLQDVKKKETLHWLFFIYSAFTFF